MKLSIKAKVMMMKLALAMVAVIIYLPDGIWVVGS